MLKRREYYDAVSGRYVVGHWRPGARGGRGCGVSYVATSRWKRLRLAVFERDGYECQGDRCQMLPRGRRLVSLGTGGVRGTANCDHIVPVWQGMVRWGGDVERAVWDMDNLQTLCIGCHIEKTKEENREYVLLHGVDTDGFVKGQKTHRARPGDGALKEARLAYDKLLDDLVF